MLKKFFKWFKKDKKGEIYKVSRTNHGYKLHVNKNVSDYDMMASIMTVILNVAEHNNIKPSTLIRRVESWVEQYTDNQ